MQVLKLSALDYIKSFDPSSLVSYITTSKYSEFHGSNYNLRFTSKPMSSLYAPLRLILFPPHSQAFPQLEQLQQLYINKVHPEPFKCLFKNTCVKNVIPDPDMPHGCDENSPEYDSCHWNTNFVRLFTSSLYALELSIEKLKPSSHFLFLFHFYVLHIGSCV